MTASKCWGLIVYPMLRQHMAYMLVSDFDEAIAAAAGTQEHTDGGVMGSKMPVLWDVEEVAQAWRDQVAQSAFPDVVGEPEYVASPVPHRSLFASSSGGGSVTCVSLSSLLFHVWGLCGAVQLHKAVRDRHPLFPSPIPLAPRYVPRV